MLEKIKQITEEQTQRYIFYGLAVLIFALPVPQLFMPDSDRAVGMQATLLTFAAFYFSLCVAVECINKRWSLKDSGLAVKCVLGLVLVALLSIMTSCNRIVSLYGTYYRREGFFSLLGYYLIFVVVTLLRNEKYRRRLLHLFLLLGVLVVALGVVQYTGICVLGSKYAGDAYVPMKNPNFYGAFTVLFTGVGMGGFFSYKREAATTHHFSWWNGAVWYALVLIGYIGCVCASSTLVYAGLIMMLLMYLFLEFLTKRRRILPFLALVAGLFLVMFLFDLQKGGDVTAEIKTVGEQIKAEGSVIGDRVGSGRMKIWKETIAFLPEYGILGCGIECMGLVWIEKLGFSFNSTYVDKAHNEYLNLWITEGVLAPVIYLVFLFVLFIPGIKQFVPGKKNETEGKRRESDEISKIALFAFFGYIAQAFFNISVVQVAPYFWMICGLLYSRKRNINEKTMDC